MRIPLIAIKIISSILVVAFIILFTGYQLGSRLGLFIALLVAISWVALLWTSDERHWLAKLKLTEIRGQDSMGLIDLVARCSALLHMTPPRVHLSGLRSGFAFSISTTNLDEHIIISRELLQHLEPKELECLIIAELTSLWLRKKFRFRWPHLLARSIGRLWEILESPVPGLNQTHWLSRSFESLSYLFLRIAGWRSFEIERDKIIIALSNDRHAMASLLWKLTHLAQAHPLNAPTGSRHLFLVVPDRKNENAHILSLHSSLSFRLRRIIGAELI